MSLSTNHTMSRARALIDSYGREVRSLRLSVTQRCDLICSHCHREGQSPSDHEMTVDEISRVVGVSSSLGIGKVKITGGEPLVREDIVEIVESISPMLKEVSLTTNGSRLAQLARPLMEAGLRRVNVSLHTLDPSRYTRLCGIDLTARVVDGIKASISAGLDPVKVNMVVFKGENDSDIGPMMEFCAENRAVLQLIEYETDRAGTQREDFATRYYPLRDFEEALAKEALETSINELHRRRRYRMMTDHGQVTVEIVRPMHNTEFCSNCTRIRLSSDGLLKPCLLDRSGEVDILSPLRAGASDDELRALFTRAVGNRRPYWR